MSGAAGISGSVSGANTTIHDDVEVTSESHFPQPQSDVQSYEGDGPSAFLNPFLRVLDLGTVLENIFALFAGGPPQAHGHEATGVCDSTKVQGSVSENGFSASGSAEAKKYAGTDMGGSAGVDEDGVYAEGHIGARAGVSATAEGTASAPFGSISGRVTASAETYAEAKGRVHVGLKGAEASAEVEAGAMVKTKADGQAQVLGGLAKASGEAHAESGTGATATGDAVVTYDPLNAAVSGSAGAFAGARAGFSAKAGGAGASVGTTAEAWAGVGAKAEFDAGLKDGKFHFSAGIGVALGVGAFLKIDFEIDFNEIGKTLGNILNGVGALFGGGKGDGSLANSVIDKATQMLGATPTGSSTTLGLGDGQDPTNQTAKGLSDRFTSNIDTSGSGDMGSFDAPSGDFATA